MFTYIKDYYENGLYTDDDLATLRAGGMITEDEYNALIDAES